MKGRLIAAFFALSLFTNPAWADAIDHYTLIMSWTPGLCWQQPSRKECADLTLHLYGGRNLTLLALSPDPPEGNMRDDFCFASMGDSNLDRAQRWCEMDEVPIRSGELRAALAEVMPAAQSCQERGSWARYGSCSLFSPDEYFRRAVKLAKEMAGTLINARIVGSAGQTVKQAELESDFEMQFGEGSAKALSLVCKADGNKAHLVEVRVTVASHALTAGLDAKNLWIPKGASKGSCPSDIVIDAPKDMASDTSSQDVTEQPAAETVIPGQLIPPATAPVVPSPHVSGPSVLGPAITGPSVSGPTIPGSEIDGPVVQGPGSTKAPITAPGP